MLTTIKNVVFISAFTGDDDLENRLSTRELSVSLKALGAKFTPVKGVYKGKTEDSFMVELDDTVNLKTLLGLSLHFNQECIMHVGDKQDAYLLGFEIGMKYTTELGKFHEIDWVEIGNEVGRGGPATPKNCRTSCPACQAGGADRAGPSYRQPNQGGGLGTSVCQRLRLCSEPGRA